MSLRIAAHLHEALPVPLRLPGRTRCFTTSPESTHLNDPKSVRSFLSDTLKLAARAGLPWGGKQVHGSLARLGLRSSLGLHNQLLHVYVKCGEIGDAHKLFDEMPIRNVVTWNTVICGLVGSGGDVEENLLMGICYFRRMLMDSVRMDGLTLNGLLRACAALGDVDLGKQMHCSVVKFGFEPCCFVSGAIVDLYGKLGLVKEARSVFDQAEHRDVVSWNVMLSCYALHGLAEEAFAVFNSMRREDVLLDGFTFSSILKACRSLVSYDLGMQIHGIIVKLCLFSDVLVATGLLDMYVKSGHTVDAREIFDAMAARTLVSWNTMIVGYGQLGEWKEAMALLQEMLREGFFPDDVTLASTLSSCGSASASYEIMCIHAHMVKVGLGSGLSVINALIYAYSKCGCITGALHCFNTVANPDVVTWSSLIYAYAYNSLPEHSIDAFEKMLTSGVKPEKISYLGVLSACSHAGLVAEGLHYFKSMTKEYQLKPDEEHYACLVDLLGRAGLLDEAFDIVASVPSGHGSDALGALIGACQTHGNIKLAEWASDRLIGVEPKRSASYTSMANTYASKGHWCKVAKVHKTMRKNSNRKPPGYSWTEVACVMHKPGDKVPF